MKQMVRFRVDFSAACSLGPGKIDLLESIQRTGSLRASNILASWERECQRFVTVMPRDYKRVLQERAQAESEEGERVRA